MAAPDPPEEPGTDRPGSRKAVLLRLDPAVHEALARWAAGELRSVNAQVEWVLRRALAEAGRMPADAGAPPRRGRPPGSGAQASRVTSTETTSRELGGPA